ncbi:MAG: nuclear transport factor 2 family protein [Xanthobacteraceae bacterium]|nr:nuclear transport factor 2 family protein [Xanthobacteraceae bacterium]
MQRDAERAIEWDCAQVLTRFFNDFDQWRYADMADLFAPDGVWHRQGQALAGRAAILAALAERSTTQRVPHVVTNVQIEVIDADTAASLLYVTAYRHDSGAKQADPPRIRAPYLLLVVPGRLRRTSDGWKIARMEMNRAFEFEA